jgi:uncharacterized protein YfaS (alpha-2-macroglobulin family)
MIGVRPLFNDKFAWRERQRRASTSIIVDPDGKRTGVKSGLRYELLRIESALPMVPAEFGSWNYEPVKSSRRIADGSIDATDGQAGAYFAAADLGPLPPRRVSDDRRRADLRCRSTPASMPTAGSDTPDLLETALDKPEYRAGDTMNVCSHRAHRNGQA